MSKLLMGAKQLMGNLLLMGAKLLQPSTRKSGRGSRSEAGSG